MRREIQITRDVVKLDNARAHAAIFDVPKPGSDATLPIGVIALPNAASVTLHERLGFEKAAHLKEAGFKFAKWIDVGYWQLSL